MASLFGITPTDLFSGILVAFAISGLGFLTKSAWDYTRYTRPIGRVWGLRNEGKINVVIEDSPDKPVEETDARESLEKSNPGDTRSPEVYRETAFAMADIHKFLGMHFKKVTSDRSLSRDFAAKADNVYTENLIVIGGPKHNMMFTSVKDRFEPRYTFEPSQGYAIIDRTTGELVKEELRKDVSREYALATVTVRTCDEKPRKRLVVFAGYRAKGNLVAAKALLDPHWLRETLKELKMAEEEAILEQGGPSWFSSIRRRLFPTRVFCFDMVVSGEVAHEDQILGIDYLARSLASCSSKPVRTASSKVPPNNTTNLNPATQ